MKFKQRQEKKTYVLHMGLTNIQSIEGSEPRGAMEASASASGVKQSLKELSGQGKYFAIFENALNCGPKLHETARLNAQSPRYLLACILVGR